MIDCSGKNALVTGSGRGIGKEIALRLAQAGANIGVCDMDLETAKATAGEIEALGRKALALQADVSKASDVQAVFATFMQTFSTIDILVNNAGITRDGLLPRMNDEAWDDVIDTNLRGAYLCTKFVLRNMMNSSGGRIINISSLAGVVGNAGQANYSASKGGLIAFTKSVAREVGSRNITANVIAPGFFVTDMTDKLPPEAREKILTQIPLKRYGQPEELAELVAFLASEKSAYITAQVICIDGGVV